MKVINKKFVDLLQTKEDEIISECKGDNKLLNLFIDVLFYEVHEQSYLDSYLSDSVSNFYHKEINPEYVFKNRKTIFKDFISEILLERESINAKTYEDLDKVYSDAAFRWLLSEATNIEDELLLVFSLRKLTNSNLLSDIGDDFELDSSEYSEFKDEYELIDSFVDEVRIKAKSSNDIINIEGYSEELFEEYFNLA